MIQLQPKEWLYIVRTLEDHTDSNTYYVQAIIRKSKDGTVLDTVNLSEESTHRFTGDWQIPEDSSNEGFLVDITTSVYTDSGYTTKSSNYGDDNSQYLVQQRWNSFFGSGGGIESGGGYTLTGKEVRDVVKKELKKVLKVKETDLSPLAKEIKQLKKEIGYIGNIKIPEPEKIDLMPILNDIKRIEKEIKRSVDKKPVTPATDLVPVINKLDGDIKRLEGEFIRVTKVFIANMDKLANDSVKRNDSTLKNIEDKFLTSTPAIKLQVPKDKDSKQNIKPGRAFLTR